MDSVCFDSWPIPKFEPLQQPDAEEGMSLDGFVNMMRDFMPNGVHNKEVMTNEVMDLYLGPWSSENGKWIEDTGHRLVEEKPDEVGARVKLFLSG